MIMKISLVLILILFQSGLILAQSNKIYSPKYSIMAGTYNNDLLLQLYTESSKARIYFTTDGNVPDTTDKLYATPISIAGDQTILKINAVTIDSSNQYSSISSSFYKIDYSYDSTALLTNLSVDDYRDYLVGHWIGINENPWSGPFNIDLIVQRNGHYLAHSISAYKNPYGDEAWNAPFYYGTDADYSNKDITVLNVNSSGVANGYVVIGYSVLNPSDTAHDELRSIKFYNDGNILRMEQWHMGKYGPLLYNLTRIDSGIFNGNQIDYNNRISFYPNPVKNRLIINTNDNKHLYRIEIRDIYGILKLDEVVRSNQNNIEISGLTNGIYFLSFIDSKGKKYNTKFIKKE